MSQLSPASPGQAFLGQFYGAPQTTLTAIHVQMTANIKSATQSMAARQHVHPEELLSLVILQIKNEVRV